MFAGSSDPGCIPLLPLQSGPDPQTSPPWPPWKEDFLSRMLIWDAGSHPSPSCFYSPWQSRVLPCRQQNWSHGRSRGGKADPRVGQALGDVSARLEKRTF